MVVVLLLLLLADYGTGSAALGRPGLPEPDVTAYVLVIVAALPLLVWRQFPAPVFGVVAGAVAVYLAMGYAFGPIMLQLMIATGLLTWKRRGRLLLGVGAGYGALLAAVFTVRCLRLSLDPLGMLLHWPVSALLWAVLPAAVGMSLRIRQEAAARVRVEQSRRAASEEQLRMAQELHDVVGHGLAVIAMQAGSGQHVLGRDPDRARQALQAIQETARTSLDGLRTEIAALRTVGIHDHEALGDAGVSDASPDRRRSAPLRPHEGIADLLRLVERIRSGGLAVEVDLDARLDPETLPAAVDNAAYRIVQEALTNVLRHAGTQATARLRVRAAGENLLVEVTNTGTGVDADLPVPTVTPGVGMQGMQDRARRVGGRVEASPRPGGRFRVTAQLPLPALTREEQS